MAAIQKELVFSPIFRLHAYSDTTIPPNYSGKTCMRWSTIPEKTAHHIQLKHQDEAVDENIDANPQK